MKKYKITTNAVALSRAWTALNGVNVSGIPQVNVEDDVNEIACLLVRNIGFVPESFNMFFGAITGEDDDFAKILTDEEATKITVNFCKSISPAFLSLIKKYLKESKEQKDSITMKTRMMQMEKMTELMKDPESLARILKSFSISQGQE
jgi:hypothetical protein